MRVKIRIELMGVKDPMVWREMWIPLGITFDTFHRMLQVGMEWEQRHLYEFKETIKSRFFIILSPYAEDNPGIDASRVMIDEILFGYYNYHVMSSAMRNKNIEAKMYYIYDYGNNWEHEIKIFDFDRTSVRYAELTDGSGACPPEKCGGTPGYARMKEYLAGKMDNREYYDWLTAVDADGFDVNKFEKAKRNSELKRMV